MHIHMDDLAYSELKTALLGGAFAGHKAALVAQLAACEPDSQAARNTEFKLTVLEQAARYILNAVTDEQASHLNRPWLTMTNDDWTKAANYMERDAEKALTKAPGDFVRNHAKAQTHLAKAYYHADSSNQRKMRSMYGPMFWAMHQERLILEPKQ